jgi:hypothetical protein
MQYLLNSDMTLGFTGTQSGMTPMQLLKVAQFIANNPITASRSGDCIGADNEFLQLIQLANTNKSYPAITTHGHIPSNDSKRAFGKYDVTYPPKPYLDRNHDIVDGSDVMIATPKENEEQKRSGTWATIRDSRKKGKKLVVIFPDGTTKKFNYVSKS